MKLRTPTYRLHKPSGQGVVTIDGRDIYLGKFGTPASCSEFDRLIAEWLANRRRLPASAGGSNDITVNELILAYLKFADTYYHKRRKGTTEYGNIKSSVRQVLKLYGHSLAREFGPLALKAVRLQMVGDGHCRKQINVRVGRVIRTVQVGDGE